MNTKETCLAQRVKQERARLGAEFELPILVGLDAALCLIANLQLALRHPGNRGTSAKIARQTIDGIIARLREAGYLAHAEIAEMGNDPSCDI